MPNAAQGLDYPDANTLAGLALEEGVESRIITGKGRGPWGVTQSPLPDDIFTQLGDNDWTLLVQSVDHYLTPVSLLLDSFHFLPSWRLEDIMLSYATEGGSVGPHFDRYDVFLIQAAGQRQWDIGPVCDDNSPRLEHDQLKLLADMPSEEQFIASPGDVLYLPPGVAHHGVALDDDCITWSVGFRAPDTASLLAEMAAECAASADDALYSDPQRQPCDDPGVISDTDSQALIQSALDILQPATMANAIHRWLSVPRQDGLDFDVDGTHIRQHAPDSVLVRHGSARLLLSLHLAWLNGESYPLNENNAPLLRLLASQRCYSAAALDAVMHPEGQALLNDWIDRGFFVPL